MFINSQSPLSRTDEIRSIIHSYAQFSNCQGCRSIALPRPPNVEEPWAACSYNSRCPLYPGGLNRSTQHPFTLIRHVGMACIWRDMHGHGSCRS